MKDMFCLQPSRLDVLPETAVDQLVQVQARIQVENGNPQGAKPTTTHHWRFDAAWDANLLNVCQTS